MPSGSATPAPAGRVWKLPGVNLFASGTYRGRPWPPRVIRCMAANCRRLGPAGEKLLIPPAVLGHEEEQEWLDRTDLPAGGWVDPGSVYAVPDPDHAGHLILRGDVVNVPDEVKKRLEAGEFRFGSAEIYDDFTDDFGANYGPTLRRFGLLGAEVPQVKRLGPLPKPVPMSQPVVFGEGRPLPPPTKAAIWFHSERTPDMDRASMIAAIKAAMPNLGQDVLDALSDDQLKSFVDSLPSGGAAAPAATMGDPATMGHDDLVAELTALGQDPATLADMSDDDLRALLSQLNPDAAGDAATATMGDPATMSRDDLVAELTAAGQDATQLAAMTDDDLRALYSTVLGGATAAAPATPPATMGEGRGRGRTPARPATQPVSFAEQQRQAQRHLKTIQQASLVATQAQLASQRMLRKLKVEDATKFCEGLVREGRLTPAQVQVMALPALLPLDNTKAVVKFSENGKSLTLTAYEAKKREMAKLPVAVRFGERFAVNPADRTDDAKELRAVERFAEVQEGALKAGGLSKAQFVSRFSEMRKKKPTLTAAEYGVPAEYAH